MFATHYFELTELGHESGIDNYHVVAKELNGQLILLHKVQKGPASKSHGLQVAKLAGIPQNVVKIAQKKLSQLEQQPHQLAISPQSDLFAQLDQTDLEPAQPITTTIEYVEVAVASAVEQSLKDLDIDNLSPRQALDALYQLKQQIS